MLVFSIFLSLKGRKEDGYFGGILGGRTKGVSPAPGGGEEKIEKKQRMIENSITFT